MILALVSALAAPEVVLSFDNGGFNLPLYTPRWNGRFEQPSVAQQLAADVSRTLGRSPRVFTYLPPGRTAGRSSDPFEVLPRAPGCREGACPCPPGERCWDDLAVNLDPAASTSLFQAATAIRSRSDSRTRIEIHFTDLFEEDPASAANPADADRCVTAASTRKAVEALMSDDGGRLHHVAVGRLSAQIVPPLQPAGGAVRFVSTEDGCWTAERLWTFGGGGNAVELAMGVIVLGYGTAVQEEEVRQLLGSLQRQVSSPLALDLVMVREPSAHLSLVPMRLSATNPRAALPPLPERSTPCGEVHGTAHLRSGEQVVKGEVSATCGGDGSLTLDLVDLREAFREQAGLHPGVQTVDVSGSLLLRGDTAAVVSAVEGLPLRSPVRDRPLVHWGALVEALDAQGGGVLRPRAARLDLEGIQVTDLDRRPWWPAGVLGFLAFGAVAGGLYGALSRFAANRAFRRHMHAATDAPLASVLQAASAAAREGWMGRLLASLTVASVVGLVAAWIVLALGVAFG